MALDHMFILAVFALYQYQAFLNATPPSALWVPYRPSRLHAIDGELCTVAHIPRCRYVDAAFIHRQNETARSTWFRVHATLQRPIHAFKTSPDVCFAHALQLGAVALRYSIPTKRCEMYAEWTLDETPHLPLSLEFTFTRALTVDQRLGVVARALHANDCLLDVFDCEDPHTL